MKLSPTLRLRRDSLQRATEGLPPLAITVLIHLVALACQHSHRVWTSAYRIGSALVLSSAVIEEALSTLVRERFISTSVLRGDLRAIEIHGLLLAEDEAPPNLPIEPL